MFWHSRSNEKLRSSNVGDSIGLSPLHMVAKTKALESYDEGILELRLTTPFLTAANETF